MLLAAIAVAVSAGVAAALGAPAVVFGTAGPDVIDLAGKPGSFHVYGFQGSDRITASAGSVSRGAGGPRIEGWDYVYGDGRCSVTSPGNDSYCDRPAPWARQDWTDRASDTDTLIGGGGPEYLIGGGGDNVIKGGQSYDVITGGPHRNEITGGRLGSAIIARQPGSVSTITLQPTRGRAGAGGLRGFANVVDVHNSSGRDVVHCAGPGNDDVIFADPGDRIVNCNRHFVYRRAPSYPARAGM